jgi:lysozyme family protein
MGQAGVATCMKATYREALAAVLVHEGGYSNHPDDPGGATNWGITIADARTYWKANATATDVKRMPVEVAYDIYRKRYADVLRYDDLPAGVDYAVLDYGINSGVSRSAKVLQRILKVEPVDGKIGLVTLTAASKADAEKLIRSIYKERLAFLKRLKTWPTFGVGWARRCKGGLALALDLAKRYPAKPKVTAPRPNLAPKDVAPIDPKVIEGSDTATDGGGICEWVPIVLRVPGFDYGLPHGA